MALNPEHPDGISSSSIQGTEVRTLFGVGLLHAFTHVYHVALMPLYLMMHEDLKLGSMDRTTFLMTAMMSAYFLPSYWVGGLADRFDRRKLLGIGLLINGAGFAAFSQVDSYVGAIFCMVVSGLGGSFYHPAATAMIADQFPRREGKAFGLVGIGASVGFLLGPVYSGWRASMNESLMGVAAWRVPALELGATGVFIGILFLWLTPKDCPKKLSPHLATDQPNIKWMGPGIFVVLIMTALAFSLRDFTGFGMGSLGSLFLQKAHGWSAQKTGIGLSMIFIGTLISNPVFGTLSDKRRFPWLIGVLVIAGCLVTTFPLLPASLVMPGLFIYGFFFIASYPMVEAALMETAPKAYRGRISGIFVLVGGLIGNLAHWILGWWVENLGSQAEHLSAYQSSFSTLGLLVILSLSGIFGFRYLFKAWNSDGKNLRPTDI
jgi:FSR family fosmidomycin resistance protein-like MFS transporter